MIKKSVLSLVLVLFVFTGVSCAKVVSAAPTTGLSSPTITPTLTATIAPTIAPSPTATSTPELSRYNPEASDKIRVILQNYGNVNENDLSLAYWKKLDSQIDKYGAAKRILTLEYHGNHYFFYGGAYSLTPEAFETQMDYLCQQDYHFVTAAEVVGYIQGWITLPARSIILTTDSGNSSMNTIPSIVTLFGSLESKYDCLPHMISFIQTYEMSAAENPRCVNDACWQVFRDAATSGFFSIGSHSERHFDASKMTEAQIIADYTLSINKIKAGTGLNVFSLAWPLEVCSTFKDDFTKMGIIFAYGGIDRGVERGFTYASDDLPLCLPRLLPPNPDGISGRPNGMTLEDMLNYALNKYTPLN